MKARSNTPDPAPSALPVSPGQGSKASRRQRVPTGLTLEMAQDDQAAPTDRSDAALQPSTDGSGGDKDKS